MYLHPDIALIIYLVFIVCLFYFTKKRFHVYMINKEDPVKVHSSADAKCNFTLN